MRLCTSCHCIVKPKYFYGASPWILLPMLILGLCAGLIPGLIVWAVAVATRYTACPSCQGRELLPLESPRAVALLAAKI
jgi:hypothetical protein